MKNRKHIIWMVLLIGTSLVSCAKEPLSGVVTNKEYDKAHKSTNLYKKTIVSKDSVKTIIAYPARGGKVGQIWVSSKFKVRVKENNKIRTIKTDSLTWSSIKCGQEITYDPMSKTFKK